MTELEVTTVSNPDNDTLLRKRQLTIGNTTINTPAVATLPDKARADEEYHPDAHGVSELYARASGAVLGEIVDDPKGEKLHDRLQPTHEEAKAGPSIALVEYTESTALTQSYARAIIQSAALVADVLAVPLLPEITNQVNTEQGTEADSWDRLVNSIKTYLGEADGLNVDKPVMGLLPNLGDPFVSDLMELYSNYGVNGYVVDFDKRSPTAENQVQNINAMMRDVAERGNEDNTVFYAVNPSKGSSRGRSDTAAADITAVGLGFDLIGRRHRSLNVPKDVLENDGEKTFQLFVRDQWTYNDIPLSDLPNRFPTRSRFNGEVVAQEIENSENQKYRLQAMVNAEQQAIASRELRTAPEGDNSSLLFQSKSGVTEQAQSRISRIKDEFDYAQAQSSLEDFLPAT